MILLIVLQPLRFFLEGSQSSSLEPMNHLNLQIRNCCPAVVQHILIEVFQEIVKGFIETPLCAGASGSQLFVACMCFLSLCLAVVPVNELVTWISRLVPKYVLPTNCFLPPPPSPPLISFLDSAHVFFFHVFVCLHLQWLEITDSGRCSQKQGCSFPFFVLSFPFFFPRWNAGGRACLGFPN